MRPHRNGVVLAAVPSFAGIPTPVAPGSPTSLRAGGGRANRARVRQASSGPSGWVIAIGAVGGIIVFGTGVAVKRRHARRHRAPAMRAA
jgi:hypothetical protein